MSTRFGWLEPISGPVRAGNGQVDGPPARRYASFVVRPSMTGSLLIAHDQSGDCVQTISLTDAIGWIQSRSQPRLVRGPAAPHNNAAPGRGDSESDPILIVRGGDFQPRIDVTASTPEKVAAA